MRHPSVRLGIKVFMLLHFLGMTLGRREKLSTNYYDETCPTAEELVFETVRSATRKDITAHPQILRMFFHDCFIRGCDASVLLDSTEGNQAEKDAQANLSLRAFHVIDAAKARLEEACPNTVSCADILAMAARDVVMLSGGPSWNVLKGRKDGRIYIAQETRELPAATFRVSQLIQTFAQKGLSLKDLVALSGAHTLGVSNCSLLDSRILNFNTNNFDPTTDSEFALKVQNRCSRFNPITMTNNNVLLDSTVTRFDNNYFKRLTEGKGVLASDQDLYIDPRTNWLVGHFARDKPAFFREFAASMARMGNIGVKDVDGEVRVNCRVVNQQ